MSKQLKSNAPATLSNQILLENIQKWKEGFNPLPLAISHIDAIFGISSLVNKPLDSLESCREYPDLCCIFGNSEGIKKEDISNIIYSSSLRRSGPILFLIDGLDISGELYQNSLLKLLEEPPQNIWFWILVKNQEGLISTLQSRIQYLGTQNEVSQEIDKKMLEYIQIAHSQGSVLPLITFFSKFKGDRSIYLSFFAFLLSSEQRRKTQFSSEILDIFARGYETLLLAKMNYRSIVDVILFEALGKQKGKW